MKNESGLFVYRGVSVIAFRGGGSYSLSLIEYSWSFVSLTRKRRIKSSSFPFFYLGVLAIVLLIVGDYSLSLIE